MIYKVVKRYEKTFFLSAFLYKLTDCEENNAVRVKKYL